MSNALISPPTTPPASQTSSSSNSHNISHIPSPPLSLFPGPLSSTNQHAADWGSHRLLAYAAHKYVVIAQHEPFKRIQTLDQHAAEVTCVKWRPALYSSLCKTSSTLPPLTLATGDASGEVIVWDVRDGAVSSAFGGPVLTGDRTSTLGTVLDLQWHPTNPDILLVLHSSAAVVARNFSTNEILWRATFPENSRALHFNPFDPKHMAVSTQQGWIYFIRDMNPEQPPPHIELKYRISGSTAHTIDSNAPPTESDPDFVQMQFSPHTRNLIYFLLKRRVLVFDMSIHQAIGVMTLERGRPAFTKILSRAHDKILPLRSFPDMFFTGHEDGCVSAWLRPSRDQERPSYIYEQQASLELVNIGVSSRKNEMKLSALVVGPHEDCENTLIGIRSDGSLFKVDYWGPTEMLPAGSPDPRMRRPHSRHRGGGVQRVDLLTLSTQDASTGLDPYLHSSTPTLGSSSSSISASGESIASPLVYSRLAITGIMPSLAADLSSVAVCPYTGMTHMILLGTQKGLVQLLNLSSDTQEVVREFQAAKSLPVRGLRWIQPNKAIYFTIDSTTTKGRFRNDISVLDLESGRTVPLRHKTEAEGTFIRGIRPSPLRNYIVVLLKHQPFQVYDLATGGLMKSITVPLQITAFAWVEGVADPPPLPIPGREEFVFTTPDGQIHHWVIENSSITSLPLSLPAGFGNLSIVSSLAWQGNWLVGGDTGGTIVAHNFTTERTHNIQTERGHVRRVQFGPGAATQARILVHFNDGSCGIWELHKGGTKLSQSQHLAQRGIQVSVIDWQTLERPFFVCSDGAARLVDANSMSVNTSPVLMNESLLRSRSLAVLPTHRSFFIRALMQHFGVGAGFVIDPSELIAYCKYSQWIPNIPESLVQSLTTAPSIAQRALIVASVFGANDEIDFWRIVCYVINLKLETVVSNSSLNTSPIQSSPPNSATGMLGPSLIDDDALVSNTIFAKESAQDEEEDEHATLAIKNIQSAPALSLSNTTTRITPVDSSLEVVASTTSAKHQLPLYFDLLIDSARFRAIQNERGAMHLEQKVAVENTYHLIKKMSDFQLLLGHKDKAIELLLDQKDQMHFYSDALKACVIAATIDGTQTSMAFNNTLKLVATHLIAQDNIALGTQLLCTIGRGVDACRYLQSYERWLEAAWLAKVSLSPEEERTVMTRWVTHLASEKSPLAVHVALILNDFPQVLRLLKTSGCHERVVLLSRVLEEAGLGDCLTTREGTSPPLSIQLAESFSLYANHLESISFASGAKYYSTRAKTWEQSEQTSLL